MLLLLFLVCFLCFFGLFVLFVLSFWFRSRLFWFLFKGRGCDVVDVVGLLIPAAPLSVSVESDVVEEAYVKCRKPLVQD